jgi:GTP cyclohydrolase IA
VATRIEWGQVQAAIDALAARRKPRSVHGVPRGGCTPAAVLARLWGVPLLDAPEDGCLVVDDLIDSGFTMQHYLSNFDCEFDALFRKPHSPEGPQVEMEGWLVFPWEGDEKGPEDAVRRLLQFVGEDPDREGLLDTPRRVVKAYGEMTSGYSTDVSSILGVQFEQDEHYSGIVLLRDIPFHSMCEHHLLPFSGQASVAYIPGDGGRIVGLSKLARLVEAYARRLQVQERMTVQIVDALMEHLQPNAAACIIRANHLCMSLRGVNKDTGGMVTSELRGSFFESARARSELMSMLT